MTTTTATEGLQVVALDRIEVPDGANPRTRFDEDALRELADSIAKHGLIQPLVVRTTDDRFVLIAGERRYRAARIAGLTEVPVTFRDGDESSLELAVDENLHRQDLDPVEQARAFHAILRTGRLNKKQLAARVSKSPQYVNDRLRLLDLPEAIQEHVATSTIPVRLARQLIDIARVSEPVAVACVHLVAIGEVPVADLEERPERLIGFLGDHEWPDPQPIALGISNYHRYPLDVLPLPAEGSDDIRERHAALGEEVGYCFDSEDADAARAYGCLLEFSTAPWSNAYITDPAFIADRVRLKLDDYEGRLAEHQEQAEAQAAARADGNPTGEEDAEKEQRRREREQREQVRQAAISGNFELGRKLQLRYDAPKLTKPVARLLALLVLDGVADRLAGRGLRYTFEDWQITEPKQVRGKTIDKARYPEPREAGEQMYAWIERARTPEQLIGRLLQALIAAHMADQDAVAASNRVYWELPGQHDGPGSEIRTLLDRLAKPVLPRPSADTEASASAEDATAA